jgi:enediyne polyketide synthase
VRVSRRAAEAPPQAGPLILDAWETRDCFLHAIQICVPRLRLLPLSIESLETRGFPEEGSVYISASERVNDGRDYVYDIEVLDEGGQVIECISGYRCRAVDQYRNEDILRYIREIHEAAQAAQAGQSPLGVREESSRAAL